MTPDGHPTYHLTQAALREPDLTITLATALIFSSATIGAADWDDGNAAYNAGDYQTALNEWMQLAERGDAKSQSSVGFMYHNGFGVPQDFQEAAKWFRLSAEQGYAKAQSNLGSLYTYGEGLPQDFAEAARWYRLAAEQGFVPAQLNLGWKYDNGEGLPQDFAEAAKWYRLAAEQGDAVAQSILGDMYSNGEGIVQSDIAAYIWYHIAAANGNEHGSEYRELTAKIMAPAEISEAQRLAAICVDSNYQDCNKHQAATSSPDLVCPGARPTLAMVQDRLRAFCADGSEIRNFGSLLSPAWSSCQSQCKLGPTSRSKIGPLGPVWTAPWHTCSPNG
jgi:uncharacterized protein